ncbi:MAG TPA: L,D-transpeptidase [Anaerolineales bacterium]|nr:L,D-transpeptidase [Anaerolineales bacterium]
MNLFSRRDFLKLSALSLAGMALDPWRRLGQARLFQAPDFPRAKHLGRVAVGMVELKVRPDTDSQTLGVLYEDAVVEWQRELVGRNIYRTNQRWVETPQGFIWSPYLQPVENAPNSPLEELPQTSLGPGMWVEVSQPYVDLVLDNPPARSPLIQDRLKLGLRPRLYYSQITWVDQVRISASGQVLYRVNEKYGTYGDIFWADGRAFRPLTPEEMAPINPDAEDKRVVVNIANQTMSCFEGSQEVFFTRISSGTLWSASGKQTDAYATPIGEFPIWRKLVSLHMSGGTTGGGWDLPAVGWVSLFVGSGVAIHSTFWHNNFGEPMSRGCVNARPQDSQWVFRWTLPKVSYDPGDLTASWPGGTKVKVIQG